ncbi:hypothetical protein FSARC_2974 [Fusarium sarcochroum]|uniref:Uncharacterized protein n=1 Tax=Fusarium sarcochroum TaxID=1208366 RepID=A0A8H4U5F6_9HYPO|nr:hypothetical protein FSARC_2974 [Fusarium sarcochroum]
MDINKILNPEDEDRGAQQSSSQTFAGQVQPSQVEQQASISSAPNASGNQTTSVNLSRKYCLFCTAPTGTGDLRCNACEQKRRVEGYNPEDLYCAGCTTPIPPKFHFCEECSKRKSVSREATRRAERKQQGTCLYCVNPVVEGLVMCQECRETRNTNKSADQGRRKRTAQNELCVRCWKHPTASPASAMCEGCLNQVRS